MNTLMQTYQRLDVSFERGQGCWLYDISNKPYLDAISGIAVCGLGHAHPAIAKTLAEQSQKLVHTSNLYRIPAQESLSEALCQLSGMSQAFFCNSGAEANEAAIKLARLNAHTKGNDHPEIIVMSNAFHGRTLATLTATGNRKAQAGFEPLVPGFIRAEYNNIDALEKISGQSHNVCAVMLELVQGEGGVTPADQNYVKHLRELCRKNDWLMIVDEVQTGMGRTGRWFSYEHYGIQPDIITLAKGLGNGYPIGACLAKDPIAQHFQPGTHGSTFGGSPLGCSVASQVISVIKQLNLVAQAERIGLFLRDQLKERLVNTSAVKEVRGLGLMIGIECQNDCSHLVNAALSQGLLINVTQGNVIRLLPPLIITEEEATQLLRILVELIQTELD